MPTATMATTQSTLSSTPARRCDDGFSSLNLLFISLEQQVRRRSPENVYVKLPPACVMKKAGPQTGWIGMFPLPREKLDGGGAAWSSAAATAVSLPICLGKH